MKSIVSTDLELSELGGEVLLAQAEQLVCADF